MRRVAPVELHVDDERLAALRRGDEDVLEDTLRALLPRVRVWLHHLLGPRNDLDDACQDALVELARALPAFEGRSTLRTYAHRVAVRVAYRYYGRAAEASLELVPPPAHELDIESQTLAREALRRLHACLRTLPPKPRVAFVLCAIEGLEPGAAAAIEGVPGFTMRARVKRARALVEARLAADPYVAAFMPGGRP